ncbi:M20/M25/M40 family metallo-hydrolase [Apilactobacillus ozensis]|uniref:M20/M25/M40 family metallo-hydrolase n=1 Tax=Apilactobacillus ozensis TaxID=866801 RepID=UPI002092490D|nr:M20/M25/M40 family metallo-hydrolase [Apilactobacillus ozensis]
MYTVESFGKAAHSSTPEKGIDAIENLINYRNTEKQLFKGFTERDKELGSTIYTPDIFRGGQQVNSIPDYAYQQVMVRTIPQLSNEKIIDKIKNLVNKLNHSGHQNNFKLKVNFSGNPVKTDKNSEIIKVSRETFNKVTGENLPIKSLSMGTDASQFTNRNSKLSAIVFGPGNNTAHQTNEYIDLPSYFNFIEVYKKIAIKYLS